MVWQRVSTRVNLNYIGSALNNEKILVGVLLHAHTASSDLNAAWMIHVWCMPRLVWLVSTSYQVIPSVCTEHRDLRNCMGWFWKSTTQKWSFDNFNLKWKDSAWCLRSQTIPWANNSSSNCIFPASAPVTCHVVYDKGVAPLQRDASSSISLLRMLLRKYPFWYMKSDFMWFPLNHGKPRTPNFLNGYPAPIKRTLKFLLFESLSSNRISNLYPTEKVNMSPETGTILKGEFHLPTITLW